MKRPILLALFAVTSLASCMSVDRSIDRVKNGENPYEEAPYYTKYLDSRNPLDQEITSTLGGLKTNPRSAVLHNQLGMLLVDRGFPKDAETEFRRALYEDKRFYPAWYNLGQLQNSRGDKDGAIGSFRRTVDLKPGHAHAWFALAFVEESIGRRNDAIDHYARAFRFDRDLLRPEVNPRVLSSKLIDDALIQLYPKAQAIASINLEKEPAGYVDKAPPASEAPVVLPPPAPEPAPAPEPPAQAGGVPK